MLVRNKNILIRFVHLCQILGGLYILEDSKIVLCNRNFTDDLTHYIKKLISIDSEYFYDYLVVSWPFVGHVKNLKFSIKALGLKLTVP